MEVISTARMFYRNCKRWIIDRLTGGCRQVDIRIEITENTEFQALGGYLAPTLTNNGAATVHVNPDIVLNLHIALKEMGDPVSFHEIMASTVLHEMLHILQEAFGRRYKEGEIEMAVLEAEKICAQRDLNPRPAD